MKLIRIGIIDSGVNLGHPHIGNVAGGVTICSNSDTLSQGFQDRLGHGTAVAALIHHRAPEAELFAVKVFDQALSTDLTTLLSAIDWCLSHQMDLINLSLGTTNNEHRCAIEAAVARTRAAGGIIVSAAEIDGVPALPGCLSGVIGVQSDPTKAPGELGEISLQGRTVITAAPWAREIPGVPREKNLYGISFAVAHVTAAVARSWSGSEEHLRLDQLELSANTMHWVVSGHT